VSVEIAEQFIMDCPFYVAGTFAAVMESPNERSGQ